MCLYEICPDSHGMYMCIIPYIHSIASYTPTYASSQNVLIKIFINKLGRSKQLTSVYRISTSVYIVFNYCSYWKHNLIIKYIYIFNDKYESFLNTFKYGTKLIFVGLWFSTNLPRICNIFLSIHQRLCPPS